ncbi:MAG: HugZ family protein [Hyphomicrobiales bacterium]|nr:HugZ family protein [Hyphomicrobiales bacterium]
METADQADSATPGSTIPGSTIPGIRTPGLPEGYDARGEAHRLLRTIRAGMLATLGQDGFPFASLVNVATEMSGKPLLLLSGLSAHTQNLLAQPRASILLAETGKGDPLAHPRLTVTGTARRIDDGAAREQAKARFLARHPKSALYADFGDFDFWRLDLDRANLNGGFARAAEFDPDVILTAMAGTEELLAIEPDALEHMNADHAEAVQHYATVLLGLKKARWRAVAIDPEGIDLAAGDLSARLPFPSTVRSAAELRKTLAKLASLDRAASAGAEAR